MDAENLKRRLSEILLDYPLQKPATKSKYKAFKHERKSMLDEKSVTSTCPRYTSKPINPNTWSPYLILPSSSVDKPQSLHKLVTRVIAPFRFGSCTFLLEDTYMLLGSLPRSYFSVLQEYQHTFVFDWPRFL